MTAQKASLRGVLTARRAGLTIGYRTDASSALIAHFPIAQFSPQADVIAGYWPIRSELDCRPLLRHLHDAGFQCALPICVDGRLIFREWSPTAPLQKGQYGIETPLNDAELVIPQIILCPLLGFDAVGNRLGYGGGFYDKTLSDLSGSHDVKLVGVAYSIQSVAALPSEPHDFALNGIVTELGYTKFDAS